MEGERIILSNSKIKVLLQCPRKYKYRYIDKIETEIPRVVIDGMNIHLAFKHFFNIIDPKLLLKDKTFEQFRDYFHTSLFNNSPKVPNDRYLRAFWNFSTIEAQMLLSCKKHFSSKKDILEHFYPHSTEVYLKSEEDSLSGIIDRRDLFFPSEDSRELVIIDYKPKPPKPRDIKGKLTYSLSSEFRRQCTYYKILSEKQLPSYKVVKMIGVFYLSGKVIAEDFKKATLKAALKARDKCLKIIEEGEFLPVINNECLSTPYFSGCEYYHICRKTWPKESLIKLKRGEK